ncbi:DUF7263 family protein [Halorussus pelagicus]|uniref:DUF7263 family protein n=1 Tax=Halorussus pelagicus TaxID=2505977 RepID=UPI001FB57F77|nr:hypothetical protein [Halorussus pelagicus]
MTRGQMNLPALAVALLVVTSVTVVSLGLADRAYLSAERDADERRIAVALSERLVAPDSQVTTRANVLDSETVADLNHSRLRSQFPVTGDADVEVRLGDRTLAVGGDPTGGTTVRRIVLVENRTTASLTPDLSPSDPAVTLPRRSPRVEIELTPLDESNVKMVKANENVVLRNESGLRGRFEVRLSRFETTTLAFESDGALAEGSVELTYYPAETSKAVLAVTVDD